MMRTVSLVLTPSHAYRARVELAFPEAMRFNGNYLVVFVVQGNSFNRALIRLYRRLVPSAVVVRELGSLSLAHIEFKTGGHQLVLGVQELQILGRLRLDVVLP